MYELDTLKLIYGDARKTAIDNIFIFMTNENFCGAINSDGNILIEEIMNPSTIRTEQNKNLAVIAFIDNNSWHRIYRVDSIAGACKLVYRSKYYGFERLSNNAIIIAGARGTRVITKDGKVKSHKDYLNIIEFMESNIKALIGVNFLFRKNGNIIKSIDIMTEQGLIKHEGITDLSKKGLGKYYLPESIIYRRRLNKVKIRHTKTKSYIQLDDIEYRYDKVSSRII